jgi:hypothetical protein
MRPPQRLLRDEMVPREFKCFDVGLVLRDGLVDPIDRFVELGFAFSHMSPSSDA